MKLKAALFLCCFGLLSTSFADNHRYYHPKANSAESQEKAKTLAPGYCEIEILNQSYDDVRVYGIFDDGSTLVPFNVYNYFSPYNRAYIDLFYYGYCHDGMTLYVEDMSGYRVYQGYTRTNTTLRFLPAPYLTKQLKVDIQNK